MNIGVPTELKDNETRVGMTPAGVEQLVAAGHNVVVESGAGQWAGHSDDDYRGAGATIADNAEDVWSGAELIVKVKEPVGPELDQLRKGLTVFTYFHLAADEELTRRVVDSGVTAIAYETVRLDDGSLPLLSPMSEVAGRLAVQAAATQLLATEGGPGRLMGGVPGVPAVDVLVLGAGVAGAQAVEIAVGLDAQVTAMDIDTAKLRHLDSVYGGRVRTRTSNPAAVREELERAQVVIGTVLIHGSRTPELVSEDDIKALEEGTLLVDVAVDQGGCFWGTKPTTYSDPTYTLHGVTYYAVANMPAAVPVTATEALASQTLPYVLKLADGWKEAMREDTALAAGLQAHEGAMVEEGVASQWGYDLADRAEIIG